MKRVALMIVTGYLGAGKTTRLRDWLPLFEAQGKKGLLIVNEVGEVNVDGASLRGSSLEERELLGGCACCSLRGDLYNALLEGIENYRPDYILLETSGLAEPSELLDAASAPKLRQCLEVTDVVTVVDTPNIAGQLKRGQLARMQAEFASVILLNKEDLASDKEISAARTSLREIAPSASLLDSDASAESILARTLGFLKGDKPSAWAFPKKAEDEGHHHHHHAGFFALNINLPKAISEEALRAMLKALPLKAYRVKGFAKVIGSDRPWIFQRVGELPPQATPFALEGVNVPIGMVVIGAGLSEEDVAEAIAPLEGRVVRVSA